MGLSSNASMQLLMELQGEQSSWLRVEQPKMFAMVYNPIVQLDNIEVNHFVKFNPSLEHGLELQVSFL